MCPDDESPTMVDYFGVCAIGPLICGNSRKSIKCHSRHVSVPRQDVGDHSAFVGDISERLPKQFEPIARHLSKIHYRFFCDKFVQSFVARFVAEVHKCRKISEKGAQQLLLDTALIKTTLLEAPVIAGQGRQMPTAYSNYVLSFC